MKEVMKLSEEAANEKIPSGELQYTNRVGWALTYLKQSSLIESPKRGVFKITKNGIDKLKTNPDKLEEKDLKEYPEYQEFYKRSIKIKEKDDDKTLSIIDSQELTPEEMIDKATSEIRKKVCNELVEKVREINPDDFEKLVIKVLIALGYGENSKNNGIHTGKTGDGGIDGVINQDKLGLDSIYIQAKRYRDNNIVPFHDVRDFVGALSGKESKGARKGVFITSSDFNKNAIDYVEGLKDSKVILINGMQLAEIMYDYNVGVSEDRIVKIKKFDSDFFDED